MLRLSCCRSVFILLCLGSRQTLFRSRIYSVKNLEVKVKLSQTVRSRHRSGGSSRWFGVASQTKVKFRISRYRCVDRHEPKQSAVPGRPGLSGVSLDDQLVWGWQELWESFIFLSCVTACPSTPSTPLIPLIHVTMTFLQIDRGGGTARGWDWTGDGMANA